MAKNKLEYIYPLWLRVWHMLNALMFLCLIISGISLQYSGTTAILIDFETAIQMHNICGLTLTFNYLFFIIGNFASGNYKHYFPKLKGITKKLIKQAHYYVWGIFQGEEKPFPSSKENKFNPLQQITYMKIMYAALPISIITGLGLLFPEILLEEFLGESGLLYTAFLHTIIGFFLSLFLIGHIYLGTTGTTMSENFKAIITGWEEVDEEEKIKNNK